MEKIQHANLLYAILTILLSGILWSCTDEHVYTIPTIEDKGSVVTFSIKVPGVATPKSSGPTTYALGVTDENAVNEVVVLLFDSDGSYTYQPTYISGNSIITNPEDSRIKTFTLEIPEGTYNMVVLANSHQSLNNVLSTIGVGQSKAVVLNKLLLSNSGKWNAASVTGNYIHIPMWGEGTDISVTTNMTTPIKLVRMVAKIDVALTTPKVKDNFNLESILLYNYNDKGHIVPDTSNWNSSQDIATAPTIPSDAIKNALPLVYNGAAITKESESDRGVSCTNEIYTFEATAGNVNDVANNTCLVVGGYFSGDSVLTYYRIDFTNTSGATTYLPLLRNHRYEINITDVKERGLPTALQAFSATPTNIEANIKIWDDAQITQIMFDEQYILGVSQDEFIFSSDARAANSSDNELAITTDAPNGWIVEKVVDAYGNPITWLSVNLPAGDANATTATKLILTNNNTYNRKGFIHLKAGKLTYIIPVEQNGIPQPEANSYIVTPNGPSIMIPVSRASIGANTAFTAELVWTDNSKGVDPTSNIKEITKLGTGSSGYIIVKPGSASGNALVAIKSSGKILWSWHIWVTDYKPSGTFMDRNLGAIGNTPGAVATKGLLYQWGRKDPFPGSSSISGTSESMLYNATETTKIDKTKRAVSSNFANSVINPATFYTDEVDWYGKIKNDKLWGVGSSKTVYDPCPDGWRVPDYSVWNGLKGKFIFNVGITALDYGGFYPAAGCRDRKNGNVIRRLERMVIIGRLTLKRRNHTTFVTRRVKQVVASGNHTNEVMDSLYAV